MSTQEGRQKEAQALKQAYRYFSILLVVVVGLVSWLDLHTGLIILSAASLQSLVYGGPTWVRCFGVLTLLFLGFKNVPVITASALGALIVAFVWFVRTEGDKDETGSLSRTEGK